MSSFLKAWGQFLGLSLKGDESVPAVQVVPRWVFKKKRYSNQVESLARMSLSSQKLNESGLRQ